MVELLVEYWNCRQVDGHKSTNQHPSSRHVLALFVMACRSYEFLGSNTPPIPTETRGDTMGNTA